MAKWKHANCFGYAVGIDSWMHMPTWDEHQGVDYLEEKYGWKPVEEKDMVLGKRYVAFRYGADDYHFLVRHPNGHWSHKQGGLPPEAISEKVALRKAWRYGYYNYRLYLFEA